MTELERKLLDALMGLLDKVDSETCTHESTHRGGAIWTICGECGQKWADDEGGFKPHRDAPEVSRARAAVAEAEQRGEPTNEVELATFLREAARYFRKRDTNGEDMAWWANVYNAENCEKAADRIEALERELAEAKAALEAERGKLEQLEQKYSEEVARYEGMKERGNLTRDWGECALVSARETLREIAAIRARGQPPTPHHPRPESNDGMATD